MDRLISAEKTIEVLKNRAESLESDDFYESKKVIPEFAIEEIIAEVPTVANSTMNGDLISRESIREALKKVTEDTDCPIQIASKINQYLDDEPAAEVNLVIAHWERMSPRSDSQLCSCSKCGYVTTVITNCCGGCGASMDDEVQSRLKFRT